MVVPRATPGVRAVPCASFAGDPQAEVEFDAVAIQRDWVLGREGLASVKERMATLLCADMTGGLERVLELTAAYVKGREQFGRPIGSFQAVQHALADMATTLEGARYATYQAAWRLQQGLPAAREVAIAQAWTGPAYKNATLTAHQLHGGMGVSDELNVAHYGRRLAAIRA